MTHTTEQMQAAAAGRSGVRGIIPGPARPVPPDPPVTDVVDLDVVLTTWEQTAAAGRQMGDSQKADVVARIIADVRKSAAEYLAWMDEQGAILRSGRTTEWLRSRFDDMAREGNAKLVGRRRYYRRVAIPQRLTTR